MAQFTATSLARLLKNVDRELLVEALEEADLTQVLYPRHLDILDDVAGNWNVMWNVLLGGLVGEASKHLGTAQADAYALITEPGLSRQQRQDIFHPTGVLFIDAMIASILSASEIFAEGGVLHSILTIVSKLDPTFPEPTNIYDINIAFDHADTIDGVMPGLQEFVDDHEIHPAAHESFTQIVQGIGINAREVKRHLTRFLTEDLQGERIFKPKGPES